MKTAQQTNVAVTFECINCRLVVTEKMNPIHAKVIQEMGGCCCVNCCYDAEHYYATQEYMAFEEAEEDCLY